MREIHKSAQEIRSNWTNVNYGAKPYLDAMSSLSSIHDNYYMDDANTIVLYFLSNASTWKGDKAKEIKNELKQMLKN